MRCADADRQAGRKTAYPGALPVAVVQARLAEAAENSDHEFWSDDVNLLKKGSLVWTKVLGHRQLTDAYLLAIAVHNKGCLVTMDGRVFLGVVTGAKPKNLSIISDAP